VVDVSGCAPVSAETLPGGKCANDAGCDRLAAGVETAAVQGLRTADRPRGVIPLMGWLSPGVMITAPMRDQ